jgi:hypothetical protein
MELHLGSPNTIKSNTFSTFGVHPAQYVSVFARDTGLHEPAPATIDPKNQLRHG